MRNVKLLFCLALCSLSEVVAAAPEVAAAVADTVTVCDTIADAAGDPVALGEIVVRTDNIIRTKNGMIVRPDGSQVKHSSGGYDLVRNLMIPGVSVNTDDKMIRALGAPVALFIDGSPADSREVARLRPSEIMRVEYMEAPTGRYAGNTTAMNFVLRKRDSGGYVAVDGLQRVGFTQGDYNLAARYYRGNTQYTLFAGTDWFGTDCEPSERRESVLFPSGTVLRDFSTFRTNIRSNSQYAQLKIRNKNERRTLRATLSFVRKGEPDRSSSSMMECVGAGMEPSLMESDRAASSRSFRYGVGLSGSFNLTKDDFLELSASASLSRNDYAYRYSEPDSETSSSTGEDYYSFHADAIYVRKFSRGNTLSFKGSEFFNVSSAVYAGSSSSWQHLWSSETLFFCEYAHPLWAKASVRVSPGVSMQFYRLHQHGLKTCVAPRMQLVFAMQPMRNHSFQIGGAYGNSFPQLALMSSAVTQVDMIRQRRGNPDLVQTGIVNCLAAYGMTVGKVSMQAVAMTKCAWHLPVSHYLIEERMLVESYRPHGRWRQSDMTLSVTWTPSAKFSLLLSGGHLSDRYSGDAHVSSSCWKATGLLTCYFGNFSVRASLASAERSAGYDLRVVTTPCVYGISASWSKGLLLVEGGLDNFFSGNARYSSSIVTDVYRSSERSVSRRVSRSAYLKISWSVDFGKKNGRDTGNIDRSVSSGILRPY